jgi:chromosome segregation protein
MYLSKLEIIGFKSFAQKVNLGFDSGISAIVGPNGCGKTNIVDAIRWVLGEQRYSALRSEKMEDVIFNGTKTRKALGMAEASLVIENTRGILPSEYSQVTIGRRVFRSGESEYLLNKVPCRLKDILDLFMDTGMGSDAYSVIELKMVETILSDKTDERRRLFEEAAGVTKYKHRRKAAYRKLESVQADLVRVNDIVTEVQKAVTTLERQAKKAEQFNDVKVRLKSMEIDLMEREFAQLLSHTRPLEERLSSMSADKDRIDLDLGNEEVRLEHLRSTVGGAETRLAEAQRDASLHRERIHRVEEKNLVAAERMSALRENIRRYEAEQAELHAEANELEGLKLTLEQRMLDLGTQDAGVAGELERLRAGLQECASRLDARKADLQSLNDRTITLVHEIAEKHTAQDRRKGRVEHLSGRATHAAEEIEAYGAEIVRLDGEIARLTAEDRRLRIAFAEAEHRHHEADGRKKQLHQQIAELEKTAAALQHEIDRHASRVEFLKGLIDSREGLGEGVRFLSSSESWSAPRRVTAADCLRAAAEHRAAIEAALGEHAGLLIVDTAGQAEEGIALLKDGEKGKATFVCLDRLPVIEGRLHAPAHPGVIGWAADVASYDDAHAPLFRLLFDRILVVDTPATASAIAARMPGIRCVTLEGEISTGFGLSRGGSRGHDEGGMIGKQGQIDELEREIESIRSRRSEMTAALHELSTERDAVDLRVLAEAAKAIEKEMSGVEVRMAQLQFEKKRAEETIARNREDIGALESESGQLAGEIAAAAPDLEQLEREKGEVERNTGAAALELDRTGKEWSERSNVVQDMGIRIATLKGELQSTQNDLQRADESIADIVATLARRTEDIRRAGEEIAAAEAGVAENSRTLAAMQEELAAVERRRVAVEQEFSSLRDEMHTIELRIRDERRRHDDSLKSVHELELKLTDLRAKTEHIRSRAMEEYEIALQLKTYAEAEFVDFAALRDEIQGLREKIKHLGNINFAAFEEYNSEKTRYEFLSSQRKDLLEAEKTLLATIEEINATAQRKFLDTFAQIRNNFIETFKSLFDPGDECDLKLEEDVDPLEAGIEIVAKPRGKRPTSIDLLSGGEKTLTATALLFAIYLVKPSPFCILDEVDAPLDDANIDRFTRILRKFSANTQFIVVTHNKRTMEAANALYGVTMEEEGVSKIVTVRFNQGSDVRSAALASG